MLRAMQSRTLARPGSTITCLGVNRLHPGQHASRALDGSPSFCSAKPAPSLQTISAKPPLSLQAFSRPTVKSQPSRAKHTVVPKAAASGGLPGSDDIEEPARKNLERAANAMRRYGWLSFWVQLILSTVSAIILLFSVAFTSQQNGPGFSLYLTLFGVVASFFSTFWAFGYTRLSRALRASLLAGPDSKAKRIRKSDVLDQLERGAWINIAGLFATLLGLQATVGLLVAKTLTNATANPFLSGGAGSYSPVLALDVFLVQASTNTVLSHFVSLLTCLWLLKALSRNPPMRRVATA